MLQIPSVPTTSECLLSFSYPTMRQRALRGCAPMLGLISDTQVTEEVPRRPRSPCMAPEDCSRCISSTKRLISSNLLHEQDKRNDAFFFFQTLHRSSIRAFPCPDPNWSSSDLATIPLHQCQPAELSSPNYTHFASHLDLKTTLRYASDEYEEQVLVHSWLCGHDG